MQENQGMPRKEKRPNYLELKKQAKRSIEKAVERHGNIIVDKTISYLSLETGLGRNCIVRIIEDMENIGYLVIEGNVAYASTDYDKPNPEPLKEAESMPETPLEPAPSQVTCTPEPNPEPPSESDNNES